TWQAYNKWPDNFSLYTNDRKDGKVLVSGVKVSYDRPYGKYVQILDNPLSQGSGEFLLWELPLAYWMEGLGFDVTYCSNHCIHAGREWLTGGRALLSVGHDEYWRRQQFDHVSAAVKAGVNVAFLSGNKRGIPLGQYMLFRVTALPIGSRGGQPHSHPRRPLW